MTATVQGINLTKQHQLGHDTVSALDSVSLEVFPGEMLAIVGRPGSGKSSLLHVLGCLQRPDSGKLSIEGVDVTHAGEDELARLRLQKVGFVFQAFNLLPNETALGNVEVPLKHQGIGPWDRQEMAEEALKKVGLGSRLQHRVGQLSAAQRQWVAIARAAVHDPAIIFADEPTRALDSTSREEVLGLLQKLNDEGRTIVLATADPGVGNYCYRVVRIAEGRVIDDEPVSKRRIIPANRRPGTPPRQYDREVLVCPRCGYGNLGGSETCRRCESPLQLTSEEEQSIESRLSGTESRRLGVESASDEGPIPGQELVDELGEVPFFSGLGAKSLVKRVSALQQEHFPKASFILRQGDPGDSFYIIRSGNVLVVLEGGGATATSIAQLGPHEGFGEMALLTGQRRSATVVAATEVEVWRLPKAAFEKLLEENLSLGFYFNRVLSQRLMAMQERIAS